MRGIIPAQVLICFGGLLALDAHTDGLPRQAWKRWLFVYVFACFLVAQGVSAYAQVRSDSILTLEADHANRFMPGKTSQKKTPTNYIDWFECELASERIDTGGWLSDQWRCRRIPQARTQPFHLA